MKTTAVKSSVIEDTKEVLKGISTDPDLGWHKEA